jgi:lysophospholipase L1-like esterase
LAPGGTYHAYGDSITFGASLKNPSTEAYPALVAAQKKAAVWNYAISGDQACDITTRQIFPHKDPPVAGHRKYSILIGTNDVNVEGVGAYESVFEVCLQAAASWLAIPAEYKVSATSSTVTSAGLGGIDRSNHWSAWTTAGEGSSVTFPITLAANGPVYAWPLIRDDDPAKYTYSLDGIVLGSASMQTTPRIHTQNGSTESLGFLRIPSVAAGKHSVTLTQTSTGNGGVSIVGIGTPAGSLTSDLPRVLVGTIPYQFNDGKCNAVSDAPCQEYIDIIEADLSLLAADGLNVSLFDTRNFMPATAHDMYDAVHPNAQGHIELSHAVESAW